MAEESDLERTEQASQRRIEQAREKGQVARSRELSTMIMLLAAGGALEELSPGLLDHLISLMRACMGFTRNMAFDPVSLMSEFHALFNGIALAIFPFFILMLIAILAGSMALSGWLFTFESLKPDFSRLSPIEGISRMFSKNSLVELFKAVVKATLITGVAVWAIWHESGALFSLIFESAPVAIIHCGQMLGWSFLVTASTMIFIAAVDVPFQLWDYASKLKMTKEEIRQESKETEGDPQVKTRIRRLQREMARRRMMSKVPKADVVVINPTHYAVALQYEENLMRAPRVVARGRLFLAQQIRDLAELSGVPILEAPELARALYHHVELDAEIPSPLYAAVAEVMAWVFQLRHYQDSGGQPPMPPTYVNVPLGMDPGIV